MDPFLSRLPYSAPLHSAYSASRTLAAPVRKRPARVLQSLFHAECLSAACSVMAGWRLM
jgi:hypothetical protein